MNLCHDFLTKHKQVLSQLDLKGSPVDTKSFPRVPGDHQPSRLREGFKMSLEALGRVKIRVFYLHAPVRSVPFRDTLAAVNDLHNEGHL